MAHVRRPGSLIVGERSQETLREKIKRIDFAARFYLRMILACIVVALGMGVYFFTICQPRVGATLIIAAAAFFSYGFNTHLQRRVRIGENTSGVLGMLRGRWDELRGDETLTKVFAGVISDLSVEERVKLRAYLYTVFDVYEYAIHLIQNGYFDHADSLAAQYENMIRKTLLYPHVVDLWEEVNDTGDSVFQNEYSRYLTGVVNGILAELRNDGSLPGQSTP